MSPKELDLRPVTHITTDAIGQPGKRVFYIQGWQSERTATVIREKIQVQSLAVGLEQFLDEIKDKFPNLSDASSDYKEEEMRIHPPVDPLFRVGELGLGYDTENDLVELSYENIERKQFINNITNRNNLRIMHNFSKQFNFE